jgi:hypothetical protein
LYQDVSSWPEDDATLLPTSHEVTEDERYFDDTDVSPPIVRNFEERLTIVCA